MVLADLLGDLIELVFPDRNNKIINQTRSERHILPLLVFLIILHVFIIRVVRQHRRIIEIIFWILDVIFIVAKWLVNADNGFWLLLSIIIIILLNGIN
jgi:hypothetical protein